MRAPKAPTVNITCERAPKAPTVNITCDIANLNSEWVLWHVGDVMCLYVHKEHSRKRNLQAVGFGSPRIMRDVAQALLEKAEAWDNKRVQIEEMGKHVQYVKRKDLK